VSTKFRGRNLGTRLKEHKTEVEEQQRNHSQKASAYTVCQNNTSMPVGTITWSTGHELQFWIGSLTKVPDRSKKQCTFERRDEVLWTGMRAATHRATRTTDFLPRQWHHITTVARTGRRISCIFFWRRPL